MNALIISGQPDESILKEAWKKIYNEYSEHSGGSEYQYMLSLLKEITLLSNRLNRIELIVDVLFKYYSPELIQELKGMNFPFEFSKHDLRQYRIDLSNVEKRSNTMRIHLQLKQKELKDLENKNSRFKITADYFDNIIIELSKWIGFQIKESDMTVKRFLTILKRYNDQQKQTMVQMAKK